MRQSHRNKSTIASPKFILPLILIIGILLSYIWWQGSLGAIDSTNNTKKTFTIEPGTPVRTIADQLYESGFIKNPLAFVILVRMNGLASNLQAGTYQLSPAMNAHEIAQSLTLGKDDIEILVVEGKRATEIATLMRETMPLYDDTWVEQLEAHEGYLFPARYSFSKQATIQQVIDAMRSKFEAEYTKVIPNTTTLTQKEIVTLASLIEREAKHDEERTLISSVLHNRLSINMALQVDATVQYVVGYDETEKTWWKKNLTIEDINIPSLYNTYEQPGLPPGPIANPGLKSLQAAANPPASEYFYYMTDKNGVTHFGRTLADHNRNISTYGL